MNKKLKLEKRTRRLIVRPVKLNDYKIWKQSYLATFPKKSKYDGYKLEESALTKEKFVERYKRHLEMRKNDKAYYLGVFSRNNKTLLGSVCFMQITRYTLQEAHISYRIFNNNWRKGYAKEAVKASLFIAYKQLKFHRIVAAIDLDNKPSISLVRSIGFRREGIRKNYVYDRKLKKWIDLLIYSHSAEDYGIKNMVPSESISLSM